MPEPRLHFVTSNENKRRELETVLGEPLGQESFDLPELQTSVLEDITRHKLRAAFDHLQKPVVVEDTSLYFSAWNELPGPLVKWFLQNLGPDGMVQALEPFRDFRANAVCCLGYTEDGETLYLFRGEVPGRIVPPCGSRQFGWDPIFQPEGFAKTFGEMSGEEKAALSMRARAARQFREFLSGENTSKNEP
ncbi:MAG: purine NTP pyrophosphatase [Deltaproteobacteria bacterium]|jgi:inosine triphosphate pyrophosphatase|nr:purine NTP pyrophosphatase [Deltaproteobacteria bacterium]MBQ31723.1 purine NTP pyrophosphatase [Deltaproteobacteria bacterium]